MKNKVNTAQGKRKLNVKKDEEAIFKQLQGTTALTFIIFNLFLPNLRKALRKINMIKLLDVVQF